MKKVKEGLKASVVLVGTELVGVLHSVMRSLKAKGEEARVTETMLVLMKR